MFDIKPVTSQNATDCGAACMVMFLDYYGEKVTLEDMIKELNIQIYGCTAADVMRVCRAHTIPDVKCFKMDAEEVVRQDRPSICWWKYNHFIVCCGLDDQGRVVICNPSRGRYAVSESLFKAFFSGVAIYNGDPQWIPELAPEA